MAEGERTIVFSVSSISLCNWFDGAAISEKGGSVHKTYTITNRGNSYKRVRAAISKDSSEVSSPHFGN